jgi:hypothetical protein
MLSFLCVFIYLHCALQKFLHIHNKPGFKSFYEEMLSRQEEQQQQQQLIKKQKEDKQVSCYCDTGLHFRLCG